MKIAYFTESILPHVDGVSLTLARLFATLERQGVDFRIFAPLKPGPDISWADRVRRVRSVAFPLYRDYRVSLPWGHGLAQLLDQDPPDLIHVVSPTPMAVWAQSYGAKRGIPVVASFHTDFVSYFRYYHVRPLEGFGWDMLRRFYNRCRATYAPSHSTVRQLQRRGIHGVQLWSRESTCSASIPGVVILPCALLPAPRAIHRCSFCGPSGPRKDLVDLVRIHQQIKHAHRLVLVGDGPMRAELEAALPDAYFAGHQSGEMLARWFASADVFVFPSTTETFGNVVLEGFASGLPAVVADRGGPPDLADGGVTGLVARPNDPADFARCVDELLADPERRRAMGEAARAAAERERVGSHQWATAGKLRAGDCYRRTLSQVAPPLRFTLVSPPGRPLDNVGGMQRMATELHAALTRHPEVQLSSLLLRTSWRWTHVRMVPFGIRLLRQIPRIVEKEKIDVVLFSSLVTAALAVPLHRKVKALGARTAAVAHGLDVVLPFPPINSSYPGC